MWRRLRHQRCHCRGNCRAERRARGNSRRLVEGQRIHPGLMNPSPLNLEAFPPEFQPTVSFSWQRCFEGVLLGTAIGDALGLPAENLSPDRIRRLWHEEWRMRFFLRRGMISDDTEHTLMVAQALLAHPDDPAAFQRALGTKFRWWLAGLPGGVGLATARACLKLWI